MLNQNNSALRILSWLFVSLLLIGGIFFVINLYSAEPPTTVLNKTITVLGEGSVVGEPDKVTIQIGVEVSAETVTLAMQENEAIVQAMMQALTAANIEQQDIQTSNFSIWPEQLYDEQTGSSNISSYHVTNQVSVTIRDIGKLGDILVRVTDAGANSIHSITFGVEDTSALLDLAREKAMADAQERASALAALSGGRLGEVMMVTELIGSPISTSITNSQDVSLEAVKSSVPIAEGTLTFTQTIQVTFLLK